MYIPDIILTIIICALGFYFYNKKDEHQREVYELKDNFKEEKKTALLDLEKYYKEQIKNLQDEIHKIKDGTRMEELENENESLKDNLIELESKGEEHIKTLKKIQDEELESTFERCYDGLIAVENTFKKLNEPYNLERIIQYHKSFTSTNQCLIVESDFLTERIEAIIECEKD